MWTYLLLEWKHHTTAIQNSHLKCHFTKSLSGCQLGYDLQPQKKRRTVGCNTSTFFVLTVSISIYTQREIQYCNGQNQWVQQDLSVDRNKPSIALTTETCWWNTTILNWEIELIREGMGQLSVTLVAHVI